MTAIAAQDTRNLQALKAAGKTYEEICEITGLTRGQVQHRLTAGQPPKYQRRDGRTERQCMCCQKTFLSEGSHNRLCGICRTKNVSPYALAP